MQISTKLEEDLINLMSVNTDKSFICLLNFKHVPCAYEQDFQVISISA